eukprot:gene3647-4188_t
MDRDHLAFVTGATGFLGTNIVEALLRKDYKVYALYKCDIKAKALEKMVTENKFARDRLVLVRGDVTDYNSLLDGIPMGCDLLFHVAASVSHMGNPAEIEAEQHKVNVVGTTNVVEASVKKSVRRFVYSSTIGVFSDLEPLEAGRHPPVVNENSRQYGKDSTSGFVRTRWMGEQIVLGAEAARGLHAIITYPTYMIGKYDRETVGKVADYVSKGGNSITGIGGGPFADASQVALAHVIAAERAMSGSKFIMGGPYSTWKEVVEMMMKHWKIPMDKAPNVVSPFKLKQLARLSKLVSWTKGETPKFSNAAAEMFSTSIQVDCSRAQNELGLQFKSLDQMIYECVQWLAENKDSSVETRQE